MSEHQFDFLVAGSTPLAAVLAGVLAQRHGAKVCWLGSLLHPLRPQRGFDLSVAPMTRPESWDMLAATLPSTLKLLGEIGGSSFERVDPVFIALGAQGEMALAHMRAVAPFFGFAMERQAQSLHYKAAYRLRDAIRIKRRPLIAALPEWLSAQGVQMVPDQDISLKINLAGNCILRTGERRIEAAKTVLVGDEAVMRHAHETVAAGLFSDVKMSSLIFEPGQHILAPVVHAVDLGQTLYQRGSGAVDCVQRGEKVQPVWPSMMDGRFSPRLAGRAQFNALQSRDGAAVTGEFNRRRATIIAGLGLSGFFLSPALADWLAGAADDQTNNYFAARAPRSEKERQSIAEFQVAPFQERDV